MRDGKKWIENIPERDRRELASAIKHAFEEGYDSYQTPCNAYNSVESAWAESGAKAAHDRLIGEDNDG